MLADAYGTQYEGAHSHKIKWKLSSIDDGKTSYAYVNITFLCDCELSFNNIKAFASDMKRQYGWDVVTSKVISGYNKIIQLCNYKVCYYFGNGSGCRIVQKEDSKYN